MRKIQPTTTCPHCGARDIIPIVYGYPAPDLLEASQSGEVVLGGCNCTFDQPNWSCRARHHRWRYPCLVSSS